MKDKEVTEENEEDKEEKVKKVKKVKKDKENTEEQVKNDKEDKGDKVQKGEEDIGGEQHLEGMGNTGEEEGHTHIEGKEEEGCNRELQHKWFVKIRPPPKKSSKKVPNSSG